MTLREAYNYVNRRLDTLERQIEQEATRRINTALDAGLARLRRELSRQYETLRGIGTLQLSSQVVTALLNESLNLLPLSQQAQFTELYANMLGIEARQGVVTAQTVMTSLAGDYRADSSQVSTDYSERAEDAARRLYGHTQNFRMQAASAIALGIQQGQQQSRIEGLLNTQAGKLKGKAENITRTESSNAFSTAMGTAMALTMSDRPVLEIWNVSWSENTCSFCAARDGKVYERGSVLYPAHGRCLTPGTVVSSPTVKAGTARQYDGEVVTIKTASGEELTVTPNHPILTTQGWLSAGQLNKSSYVLSSRHSERISSFAAPNKYNAPTLIEEVLSSLGESDGVFPVSMEVSPKDFHGDGANSKVSVVWADGSLLPKPNAFTSEQRLKLDLQRRNQVHPFGFGDGLLMQDFGRQRDTSNSFIGFSGESFSLLGAHAAIGQKSCFTCGSRLDPRVRQDFINSTSVDGVFFRDRQNPKTRSSVVSDNSFPNIRIFIDKPNERFMGLEREALSFSPHQPSFFKGLPGDSWAQMDELRSIIDRFSDEILRDRVIDTRVSHYSGPVYNLETTTGWYFSNNILTHNCKCFPILYSPRWDDPQYRNARHRESLQRLEDAGLKPNYGVSSFERGAGIDSVKAVKEAIAV